MANLNFKRKNNCVGGYNYEARGDFRKNVNFIRIARANKNEKLWDMYIFENGSVKGELYGTFPTYKDACFYADLHFAD